MKSEPLITVGTVTALVTALIVAAQAFGAPITEDQQAAILGVAAVAAPLLVAVVARRFVSPAYKVSEAYAEGRADSRPVSPSEPVITHDPEQGTTTAGPDLGADGVPDIPRRANE